MSIPRCLYTSVSWFSNAFIIVMDDIAPSHELTNNDEIRAAFSVPPFDNSTSVPIDQVECLVDMVSKMHAKYLDDPSLYRKKWILGAEAHRTKGKDVSEYGVTWLFVLNIWKKTRQNVVDGKWLGTPFSDKMIRILDDTFDLIKDMDVGEPIARRLWPYTLTHGDYHGSNILVKEDSGGKNKNPLEAVALDFQLMAINEPCVDLGKLLLIVLSPEDRRCVGKNLIASECSLATASLHAWIFHATHVCVLPRWRRAHENRLVRRNYDVLVAAGLDSKTMPFELFFMRYQFHGAFSWMLIVAVLDTLFADGKNDECARATLSSLRDTKLYRSVSRPPVF